LICPNIWDKVVRHFDADGLRLASMSKIEDRVIIVGAGPCGLVAAACLGKAGIRTTLIEASRELPKDLRASTFHPPTLDILDRFGVTDRLIERGLIAPQWQFRDRREGVVATFELSLLAGETAHPYRLQCEQWKLSEELRAILEADDCVEIVYEAEAVDVAQDDNGVTLQVRRADGSEETMRGRYLIATDGARSVIRKVLDIPFEGQTIPEIFLSMSTSFPFENHIENLATIAYMTDPNEWAVLLRTPTLWRVLLPTDPNLSEDEIKDPALMQRRLQAVCANPNDYDIAHATAYKVNERVAQRYISGRIFLAGDAAHVNNPLGGMGMNGGIQDAVNLTEKLAEVWKGASLDIMGRYERQRRKAALEAVQAQTLRNRRIMNEVDPAARKAYHDELRATVADPAAHKAYLMRSSMIESLRELEAIE
jgi:3-(3-hydroxy-phenyl)propionate hydroxylase